MAGRAVARRNESPLRLVDPETGEITENGCPDCKTKQFQLDELTRKYHGALGQIGRLRADREAEARQHELFPRAIRLFDIWREQTRHLNCDWTSERFWACVPALKAFDDYWIERAIAGLAYQPFTKTMRNGKTERYDRWETLFSKVANIEVYANRAPLDFEPARRMEPEEFTKQLAAFLLDRATLLEAEDDAVALTGIFIEMDRRVREWLKT